MRCVASANICPICRASHLAAGPALPARASFLASDFRISKVPAADWPTGSVRQVYTYRAAYPRFLGYGRGETYEPENTDLSIPDEPWVVGEGPFAPIGAIPQVSHTYGFIDGGYGIMNEKQVSIGESTCGAKITALPVSKGGKALLEAGELSRIALERCSTAKCAVQLMGDLAVKHGYYGADATPGEGGEALQVVDPHDAWVFHILSDDTGGSAVWAAQRVPEGHVSVVANQFTIRTVDLADADNFLGSDNILDVAERAGFWDRRVDGSNVDFTKAFALDRGHLHPYATRRVWRVMDLAAPSLGLSPECSTFADEYPFSVAVEAEGGLDVAAVLGFLRDHYEGTPYDMTQGPSGGPFGDPSRFDFGDNTAVYAAEDAGDAARFSRDAVTMDVATSGSFERAISIFRCSYSWVSHSDPGHPSDLLGTVWFGQYAPHASGYSFLFAGAAAVPAPFAAGSLYAASLEASYWVHAVLGNWCDRLYVHTIGEIRQMQARVEGQARGAHAEAANAATELLAAGAPRADVEALLTVASDTEALAQHVAWTEFMFQMLAKYKDGQTIAGQGGATTLAPVHFFYPKWWLESVGFFGGGGAAALEGAVVPGGGSGGAAVISLFFTHVAVAALAVVATAACLQCLQGQSSLEGRW